MEGKQFAVPVCPATWFICTRAVGDSGIRSSEVYGVPRCDVQIVEPDDGATGALLDVRSGHG